MVTGRLSFLALVSLLGCSSEGGGAASEARPTVASAASAAPTAGGAELVSGTSIGPVRIGMTRAALEALGLAVQPGANPQELRVGPYVAELDGERVAAVHVTLQDLPSGARVGGETFEASSATIATIAKRLPTCGPVRMNRGANVIVCDGGKTQLVAGGPPGIVSLRVNDAARAAAAMATEGGDAAGAASDARWTHPGMAMSFSYPDKLLQVSHKPDGATLQSEPLGTIEDRTGAGKDRPRRLTITVSVRIGKLADVLRSESLDPRDCEATTLAAKKGCRLERGSHEAQQELTFAELPGDRTLTVLCDYLGDAGKPKVPVTEQIKACSRVVSTLSYQP